MKMTRNIVISICLAIFVGCGNAQTVSKLEVAFKGDKATPRINYAIEQVKAGTFRAEDYKEWTMMKAGGASLSPFYEFDGKIAAETKAKLDALSQQITAGDFVVPINDDQPKSTF